MLVTVLMVLVVFVTTYILILPAFTLTQEKAEQQGGIDVPAFETAAEEAASADNKTDVGSEAKTEENAASKTKAEDKAEDKAKVEADAETNDSAAKVAAPADPLTFEGAGFTIAVDDKKSVLPENTKLVATELLEKPEEGTKDEKKEAEEAYKKYYELAQQAVKEEDGADDSRTISFVKFYDISLQSAGEEVQPGKPVNVKISYDKDARKDLVVSNKTDVRVVHFKQDENTDEIIPEILDNKDVDATLTVYNRLKEATFETESFSVYGVVYTVDFSYEVDGKMYEFSIPGGGFVSLEHVVEVLGIARIGENGNSEDENEANEAENASENDVYNGVEETDVDDNGANSNAYEESISLNNVEVSEATRQFVADVASVEFSSPELVWVGKVEETATVGQLKSENGLEVQYSADLTEEQIGEINGGTVENGDWALISMRPFTSEETLTVTMKTGEQFMVKVTDAQKIKKVITTSDKILQVTVEVRDGNDIARFEDLRVEELSEDTDAYREAYEAVVSLKGAEDENFDEEKCGFLAADIELLDKDGEAFEPEGTVYVKMELLQLPAEESVLTSTMEIQHLAEQDGKIDVQTVASAENITKVDDVVTAEFSVESFSTFTLTWTDDGSSTVISDQDASTTLNIQNNNGDTYATVTVHYVDTNGNNIQSPFISAVNGTTPVTIDGLLNSEIEGYEYQGAYYSSYTNENEHGDNLTSISASRASEDREVSGYASKSYSTDGYTSSTEFSDRTYFADTALTRRLWWRQRNSNGKWYLYNANGNGINQNTVYYANSGTQTYYTTSVTFSGESVIETLVSDATASDAAYETGASIYLVYENTDPGKCHATIHYGTLNTDGSFSDLQETATLDSSAASISVNPTISGNTFLGAYYSENATDTPAVDTKQVDHVLRKADGSWQYTNVNDPSDKGLIADNSHLYVIYKEKTESGTPTPADDSNIPKPSTIKKVYDNGDGTYDIQLDIIGNQIQESERKGANVLLIFDRTSSMTNSMANAPGNGQRIDAARAAVHTLVDALDPGNNPVQIAAFSFARFADPVGGPNNYDVVAGINWTENGAAITNFTDNLTLAPSGSAWQTYTYAGGTNWEAALDYANTYLQNPPDDDPTYIIFLTDGNPTVHNGTASTSGSGIINSNPTARSTEYTAAQAAADNLNTAYKFYGILCANESDGPLLQTLVTHLNSTGHDATHILGDDSNKLSSSFQNIAEYIVSQLSASDVSTNDGITSLSTVNASVSGAAGAFKYYKAYEVKYEDGKYTYVDDDGEVQEINADQVETYSYAEDDGEGNVVNKTYLYYNRETWQEAPGASYNEATGVTWDLSSEKGLKEGEIYTVRFTIWPSQEAYDLLADLNNGIKAYEPNVYNEKGELISITESERNQVYQSGGVYYMKTNTELNTSYTFSGNNYTDEIPYHQGAMDLDARTISLQKLWPENLLDDYGEGHSLDGIKDRVTLTVTKDGIDYLDVTLGKDNQWKRDDVYISCGLMTVHNGVVEIKERGHDYTVTEPGIFSYYWDLVADVYRPMVIGYESDHGTVHEATLLVLDETLTEADVNNSTIFKIDGKIYKKQSTSDNTLEASNYRRSNLNLKKNVTGINAPKDALFEYTVKIKDAADNDIWFSAVENDVYQVLETSSNVTPEYRTVEGAVYNPDDKTYTYTYQGNTYTLFAADDGTGGKMYTGFYSVPSDEEFTFKIKDGWNVRFINLLRDSTFNITEGDMDEGFSFEEIDTETLYPFTLVDLNTVWNNIEGQTITGTIVEPNNSYSVTYTNHWESVGFLLEKVKEDRVTKISGSEFVLQVKGENDIWTNALTDIKPGGTKTVIDEETGDEITVNIANPVDLGGLGIGHYRFEETNAPAGYIISTKYTYFEVYKEESALKVRLTDENGSPLKDQNEQEVTQTDTAQLSSETVEGKTVYKITITNNPGVALPNTGGPGTNMLYFFGIMLAGLAGAGLVMKRRRRKNRRSAFLLGKR